jgi:hypothetical protein
MLLDANVALLDLLEFPSLRLWPLLRCLTECSSVRFLFIVLCVITVILIYFRLSPIRNQKHEGLVYVGCVRVFA